MRLTQKLGSRPEKWPQALLAGREADGGERKPARSPMHRLWVAREVPRSHRASPLGTTRLGAGVSLHPSWTGSFSLSSIEARGA